MDFSHYSDGTVEMAVALVNTRHRVTGEDSLSDVDGLRAFLDEWAGDWHDGDRHPGRPSESDREEIVALRRRLRDVFHAEDDEAAAVKLNEILSDVGAIPRVSTHGGEPHLHFEPLNKCVTDWLGAAAAMGVATVMVDHGIKRFGVCGADDCVDVFVDTSRNRSRRHCSTTCTTRTNVAAHRARKKGA